MVSSKISHLRYFLVIMCPLFSELYWGYISLLMAWFGMLLDVNWAAVAGRSFSVLQYVHVFLYVYVLQYVHVHVLMTVSV
jgi:hypothetical protein